MGSWLLLTATALDLAFGDPRRWPHPVVGIGLLIGRLEASLYPRGGALRRSGVLLVLLTLAITGLAGWLLLALAGFLHPLLGWLVMAWLAYTCLALRALHEQSAAVVQALAVGETDEARSLLSMIVGRDTSRLDEQGILRACIETVAENTADGVIAPLCYLALGGPLLALLYKAINTLDSMIGYRNERYREFGWAAARLDDLANWLPARLCGVLMVLAAGLVSLNRQQAWRILKRDADKPDSPNAGYPEAAAAGALDIQLGGPSLYFGRIVDKPTLGDDGRPLSVALYREMVYLMYATTALCLVLLTGLRFLVG